MFTSALTFTGKIILKSVIAAIFDNTEDDQHQLDQLNDGMGGIIADGEDMTYQEAKTAQRLGELYDTYN